MHTDIFTFLIPLSLLSVLAALGFGIYALFKGGDFGRTWSNKLMRLRVLLQFIAVVLLVAAAVWRGVDVLHWR
jgi:Hypoxia induced protein conserved region